MLGKGFLVGRWDSLWKDREVIVVDKYIPLKDLKALQSGMAIVT